MSGIPGCSVARNTNFTGCSPQALAELPHEWDSWPTHSSTTTRSMRFVSGLADHPVRRTTPARHTHRCFRRYDTASLAAFTGRALMIFRAGFALNIVGSFVNGLMPLRSFVAGFLMTTNLAKPGTKKAPVFLSSL